MPLLHHLNGHGCKDKQVGKIERKGREQKPKLVSLSGGGSFPRVKVAKGSHRYGAADTHHRERRRKHLALQVPKLMPRQIFKHDDAADECYPQSGAEGGGEAEEVSEFEVGGKCG